MQVSALAGVSGVSNISFTATDSALLTSTKSIRFRVNDYIAVPQNFSTFNKLPSNSVPSIFVTNNGTQETIYVATEGGLAISKDAGDTFIIRTNSDGIQNYALQDVFVDSSGIYIANYDGIFVSKDNGITFNKLLTLTRASSVVVVGNTIFAGGHLGLYISRDAGVSFTKATGFTGGVSHIFVKGNSVYVGTQTSGLAISNDNGLNFTTKTTIDGLGSNAVRGVYVDAEDRIYAATWVGGLSILQPGATSFTNIFQLPGETYNGSITGAGFFTGVTGDSNGNIYVTSAYGGLAISSDKGASFWGDSTTQGINRYGLKAFISSSGKIYYASYAAGMSISTNGGQSFTTKTSPTPNSLGLSVEAYKNSSNEEKLYVGTVNGLYVSSDNRGSQFTILNSTRTNDLQITGDKIYSATTKGVGISDLDGSNQVYRSTETGLGHATVNNLIVRNGIIYACTNGGLSISSDLTGNSFVNKTTANGLGSNIIWGVAFDDNGNLFVGTDAGLSISTDNGNTFVNKSTGATSPKVRSLFISGGKIYAGTGSGLYISTDLTGNSFGTRRSNNTTINRILVDGSNVYVAGADYKIGTSTDGGGTFTYKDQNNGIAGIGGVTDFHFNENGDLFVITYGGTAISGKFSGTTVP